MAERVESPPSKDAGEPGTSDRPDDRWPVPYSLLLAAGLSGALWVLIIAGARWLIA